jgi:hypothetical protein
VALLPPGFLLRPAHRLEDLGVEAFERHGARCFRIPEPDREDGRTFVQITFRAGWTDELPGQRGMTHFIEHLAHQGLAASGYHTHQNDNASTGPHLTYFNIRETPAQTTVHLERICSGLAELPDAQLERERRVIRAENCDEPHDGGPMSAMFGFAGLGLRDLREWAVPAASIDELRAFSRERFTRRNLCVLNEGEIPDLDFLDALPEGVHRPIPPVPARPRTGPVARQTTGHTLFLLVPYTNDGHLRPVLPVLTERLLSELRDHRALVYSLDSTRHDADQEHRVLLLDVTTHRDLAQECFAHLADTLDAVLRDGLDRDAVLRYAQRVREAEHWTERLFTDVDMRLDQTMMGRRWSSPLDGVLAIENVDMDAVRDELRAGVEHSLWQLPDLVELGRWGMTALAPGPQPPRDVHRPRRRAHAGDLLVAGPDGLTLLRDGRPRVGIRYAEVVLAGLDTDRSVLLAASDGQALVLDPADWEGGAELVRDALRSVPEAVVSGHRHLLAERLGGDIDENVGIS